VTAWCWCEVWARWEGDRARGGLWEMCGEGRDVAVKGSGNPRNTALISYRLARQRWRERHAAAEQLEAIRAGFGPACKPGVAIGRGLAMNDVEVGRHAVMHWQAPCHARPVTEAKIQSILIAELAQLPSQRALCRNLVVVPERRVVVVLQSCDCRLEALSASIAAHVRRLYAGFRQAPSKEPRSHHVPQTDALTPWPCLPLSSRRLQRLNMARRWCAR
jgi:hypothetical protein